MCAHEDAGRFLLRLTVGGLMLFHGLHKLIDGVLIILGIFTRPAALVLAFTMIVAWMMVGVNITGQLDKTGAWAIESMVYFFIAALAVAFLGAGRYSVAPKYS